MPFDSEVSLVGVLVLTATRPDGEHAERLVSDLTNIGDEKSAVQTDRPLGIPNYSGTGRSEAVQEFRNRHRGPLGEPLTELASDIRQIRYKKFTLAWFRYIESAASQTRCRSTLCGEFPPIKIRGPHPARVRDDLAPGEQYDRLTDSHVARRASLSRGLDDMGWHCITVVVAHNTGHLHVHKGLVTDDPSTGLGSSRCLTRTRTTASGPRQTRISLPRL